MKRFPILATVGVAAAGSLLSMVVSPGVIAAAAVKAQEVLVTNGDEHPVPTKVVGPTAVTGTVDIAGTPKVQVTNLPAVGAAPLWQGTPYLSMIRLHQAGCEGPSPVPAGYVLYVQRAVTRFMTFSGPHVSAGVEITPHGSPPTYSQLVPIPTSMRSNPSEVAGFDGSVEIGLPATAATACINFSPVSEPASITIIGYLVPTP